MATIQIKEYQDGQENMIHQLIKKVYDEFVSIDYSNEGNQFFYDWIDPLKIAERHQKQNTIMLAWEDLNLVGMIEIRDNNWISLLFVDKKYHGQGIAKKLFQEALKKSILKNPKLEKFNVHASPYSIPAYQKLGFIESDVMQENNGIKYLPMEMRILK
ncbi:MAG: GNAT family N-acetyltransferase [Bacteroidota bacterium]